MALTKCKECGHEVSTKAKTCPNCGEPVPKRPPVPAWFVAVLLVIVVVALINAPASKQSSEPRSNVFTPREAALWTVSITKYSWYKSGFDNIMMLNVTIENYGKGPVKDIEITCTHSAKSGTVIDRNQKTIYETFPPGRSRTIRDFNMGFIHSQAEQTFCKITDLAVP